jgi:hypothetical protein
MNLYSYQQQRELVDRLIHVDIGGRELDQESLESLILHSLELKNKQVMKISLLSLD